MNYVIPMMGKGNRFAQAGYTLPKPLIFFNGKPLIMHLLDRIPEGACVWIITSKELSAAISTTISYHPEHHRTKVVTLNDDTLGAAHTALLACEHIPMDEPVVFIDCDILPDTEHLEYFEKEPQNAVFFHTDELRTGLYSYITVQGKYPFRRVTSVVEKEPISDMACSGIYAFESAATAKKYAAIVHKRGVTTKGELYMSQVMHELSQKEEVYALESGQYHCLGTPKQMDAAYRQMKHEPRIHCIDLDGTLCQLHEKYGNYSRCKPVQHRIDFFNSLYDAGHTIIIHTARGQLSCKGDAQQIDQVVKPIIQKWLDTHGVKYHSLVMGKPYADLYWDDKAININTPDLQQAAGMYINAEVQPRTQNRITLHTKTVVKSGPTIGNEAFFYKNVPETALKYFPRLIRQQDTEIELERIQGITASNLYTTGKLTRLHITTILEALRDIHGHPIPCRPKQHLYYEKSNQRYNDHIDFYKALDPEYYKTWGKVHLENTPFQVTSTVMHGDPVFTNIILQGIDVWFIDPRGNDGRKKTIYGDPLYDYAKVYQSIMGYDHLLNNIPIESKQVHTASSIFFQWGEHNNQFTHEDIYKRVVHLWFSLLPLHKDDMDRCRRMYQHLKQQLHGTE